MENHIKYSIYITFLLFSFTGIAQVNQSNLSIKTPVWGQGPKDREPYFPYSSNEAVKYTDSYSTKSITGTHTFYQQYINNFPVWGNGIKVHRRHDGTIIYQSEFCSAPQFRRSPKLAANPGKRPTWIPTPNGLELTYPKHVYIPNTTKNEIQYINEQEEIVVVIDQNRYFHDAGDSTAHVKVFFPDPLTSAKANYGGQFIDNEDKSNVQLESQMFNFQVKTKFENGTFKLENEYIKINDHSAPHYPVTESKDGVFYFDRSQPGFEDVNVFFHISRFRTHIDSIGYDNLCKKQILFDTHGLGNTDNSVYSSNFKPVRITFGSGGVDDAEDVTPIIHEYGHAISDAASPKTNLGVERTSLEEGICDYLASSYKAEISLYDWDKIYKWDGHNDFWLGRVSDAQKRYPDDMFGTPHQKGEIISSTLMKLWFKLGKNIADKLVLESLYYLDNGMTFLQYADVLMVVEQELFKGKYRKDICETLVEKGLETSCVVGIEQLPENQQRSVELRDKLNFSIGKAPLTIWSDQIIRQIEIIDLNGKVVLEKTYHHQKVELQPSDVPVGIYLIKIATNSGVETDKLIRQQ